MYIDKRKICNFFRKVIFFFFFLEKPRQEFHITRGTKGIWGKDDGNRGSREEDMLQKWCEVEVCWDSSSQNEYINLQPNVYVYLCFHRENAMKVWNIFEIPELPIYMNLIRQRRRRRHQRIKATRRPKFWNARRRQVVKMRTIVRRTRIYIYISSSFLR